MPIDLRSIPRTGADDWQVIGAMLSPDSRSDVLGQVIATVPTTAAFIRALLIMPFDGLITSVRLTFVEALVASDANFITMRCLNKTQSDAPIIAATDANTTKLAGGPPAALSAYGVRSCILQSVSGVSVLKFDVLSFEITSTGTLPNTLTSGRVQINLLVST